MAQPAEMTVKLYGIPNCDTIRKARRWLADHQVEYHFHDFRKDGLPAVRLGTWVKAVGWETLLNRRGTTWRQLSAAQRDSMNAQRAQALMLEQPALIKRPVLETAQGIEVGFSADRYQTLFK